MMTTVETIADMTMALQDEVRMTDLHLEASTTPTWTDALLLAETIMVMVVIHTEAVVLEDLHQGICKKVTFFSFVRNLYMYMTYSSATCTGTNLETVM